jgi:5'-deoxynucleotidase
MDRTGEFYALLFRAKNINRWGMMRNMFPENLAAHSWETAVMSHALALIGNKELHKSYNVERIVMFALYHDVTEILTGDLPTPIKYYNDDIRVAYKNIEAKAEDKLFSLLRSDFKETLDETLALPSEEAAVVKAADKLCALIKCLDELSVSNREFTAAEKTIRRSLEECGSEEAKYFMEHYLASFEKPIDDITL